MKNEKTVRRLLISLDYDKKLILKGDGRLYSDAVLLNSGIHSDSITRNPTIYTDLELSKAAGRWGMKSQYYDLDDDRVYIDLDHRVDEVLKRIGYVKSIHFKNGAIRGDLFMHRLTQNSRDTCTLINAGIVNSLSVEILTQDNIVHEDGEMKIYAEDIELIGLAVVTMGADPKAGVK